MARSLRTFVDGCPLHVIQRGNNHQVLFRAEEDYRSFLTMLEAASRAERCDIHAYVLMTNHVHILLSPRLPSSASQMMKRLHQEYAQLHNRKYARCGGLYEGRYRCSLVQSERYLLVCQRYIELNPVRAGMAAHPAEYRWSSYRCNAWEEKSDLLTPHPIFASLTPEAYRSLFESEFELTHLQAIRTAIKSNRPIGDEAFVHRHTKKHC
jgi:putative transposase